MSLFDNYILAVLEQLLEELQRFLKILDGEYLSGNATVQKGMLSDLLQSYKSSNGKPHQHSQQQDNNMFKPPLYHTIALQLLHTTFCSLFMTTVFLHRELLFYEMLSCILCCVEPSSFFQ